MCRSVLPCKNRRSARDMKAHVARRARRRARSTLRSLRWEDEEGWARGEGRIAVDEARAWTERSEQVWDRRGGDKINHFVRWARRRTDHCANLRERREVLRPQLPPGGIILEHALFHFVDPERDYNPFGWVYRPTPPRRPWRDRDVLLRQLRLAWEFDHAALNRCLRRIRLAPPPKDRHHCGAWCARRRLRGARVVQGASDLEALANELFVWGGCHGSAVVAEGQPPSSAFALLAPLLERVQGRQR